MPPAEGLHQRAFDDTLDALRTIGMSADQLASALSVLAGVVHLGCLRFESAPGGGAGATLVQDAALAAACALLGCDARDLGTAATCRRLRVGREWVTTHHSPREASDACHCAIGG